MDHIGRGLDKVMAFWGFIVSNLFIFSVSKRIVLVKREIGGDKEIYMGRSEMK